MNSRSLMSGCALVAALGACSGAHDGSQPIAYEAAEPAGEAVASADIAAPPPPIAVAAAVGREGSGSASPAGAIPVALPRIAYSYTFGFRLPAEAIKPLQERHADMCEAKGPQLCRIVEMDRGEGEGDYATGTLRLAVAAPIARSFGKDLTRAGESAKGELVASGISGEDLSKQIVDTEARLRARTLLRDRLMEVLKSRKGTVAELVEAERGVAQVNEEIDQATSWLAEMRGRVDFSAIEITYDAGSPSAGGFVEPIRTAFGRMAGMMGTLVAVMLTMLAAALPIGLFLALLFSIARRLGFMPWRRPEAEAETA